MLHPVMSLELGCDQACQTDVVKFNPSFKTSTNQLYDFDKKINKSPLEMVKTFEK